MSNKRAEFLSSALGEMLLKNRGVSVSHDEIHDIIGEPADVGSLARALNRFDNSEDGLVWRGFATTDESWKICFGDTKIGGVISSMITAIKSDTPVFINGRTRRRLIKIKDPFDQNHIKMTMADFQIIGAER